MQYDCSFKYGEVLPLISSLLVLKKIYSLLAEDRVGKPRVKSAWIALKTAHMLPELWWNIRAINITFSGGPTFENVDATENGQRRVLPASPVGLDLLLPVAPPSYPPVLWLILPFVSRLWKEGWNRRVVSRGESVKNWRVAMAGCHLWSQEKRNCMRRCSHSETMGANSGSLCRSQRIHTSKESEWIHRLSWEALSKRFPG